MHIILVLRYPIHRSLAYVGPITMFWSKRTYPNVALQKIPASWTWVVATPVPIHRPTDPSSTGRPLRLPTIDRLPRPAEHRWPSSSRGTVDRISTIQCNRLPDRWHWLSNHPPLNEQRWTKMMGHRLARNEAHPCKQKSVLCPSIGDRRAI